MIQHVPREMPGREGGDAQLYNNDCLYSVVGVRYPTVRPQWLIDAPRTAVRQNGYSVLTAQWAPIPTIQDSMLQLNRTAIPELYRAGLLAAPNTGGQGT